MLGDGISHAFRFDFASALMFRSGSSRYSVGLPTSGAEPELVRAVLRM